MRICIDMGHTKASPGAARYLDELTEDRKLGAAIKKELEARGHTVYDSTPSDSIAYPEEVNRRAAFANTKALDLFLSIHFNAGGGTGTEVLYYAGDETGKRYAERISAGVAKCLGIRDRGAKANDWVGVICKTDATAVLLETCFVDSTADYVTWKGLKNLDGVVLAVCNAVDGSRRTTLASAPKSSKKQYRVRIKKLSQRIRAGKSTKSAIVGHVHRGDVYTIVETSPKGYWGRLKSGAGWLWLPYVEKLS